MAGTAVVNRYPIAAGPLPVAGTVTVASDGGATDTPVSVGFKPSLVILGKTNATVGVTIWAPAMGAGHFHIAAAAAWAASGGISHYDGADDASAGFTIPAALHANSDVLHFVAFP